jgi:hypothetical protein
LSRPVFYLGEAVSSHPPPLAFASGRTEGSFIYQGRPLQVGGVAPRFIFSEVPPRECTASGGGKPPNDACGRRHGARSFFWLAGTHRVRTVPIWVLPSDKATPGLRQDQRGPVRRRQIFSAWILYVPDSGCRLRQAAGALIVTLLVTIQGSASCP